MGNILVFITVLLMSCTSNTVRSSITIDDLTLLKDKSQRYIGLVSKYQDKDGFIMSDKCDSLLFSGLLAAARPDLSINIKAAKKDGAWNRRSTHDCGPKFKNSRSTISRDMMLGYMWYLYKSNSLNLAIELMDELKSNFYMLKGDGTPGELFMLPAYMNTLAEMIKKLGGKEYNLELLMPASFQSKPEGYVAHLTVWHIHLRGQILGEIPSKNKEILDFLTNKNPKNPLFVALQSHYSNGNQSEAIKLLMDTQEWPNYKLPTTSNHCDDWPIQREYTDRDWGVCTPMKIHTGMELVIIYELILDS